MGHRLFILSDLHAFDGSTAKGSRPSHFDISVPISSADNPIYQLKSFIQKEGIQADKLICCGDLADKAYPAAVERAWKELQEIKNSLKATELIASVGNHDVDSRYVHNEYDAKGVLLELRPHFPIDDEIKNNEFWTHHFTILFNATDSIRYVILNSSGFHGSDGTTNTPPEHSHGRIAKRTVNRLINRLESGGRKNINVLVCHHHPQKMTELNLGDYDDIKGADDLLRELDPVKFGPWLIIHGHKHFPKLSYAGIGGSSSPVIFSAGSCSAILYPEIVSIAGNQAYLIELDDTNSTAASCCGEFQTWDWIPGRGWRIASHNTGLPSRGGFGFRGDIGVIASDIATRFSAGDRWNAIECSTPQLKHMIPSDKATLVRFLEQVHNFKVEVSREGHPILIQPI